MNTLSTITSPYKRQFIKDILDNMKMLDNTQLRELNKSLNKHSQKLIISENPNNIDFDYEETNIRLIKSFIKTKKLKGLSQRTIDYYLDELNHLKEWSIKSFIEFKADDLKEYLRFKQSSIDCSNVTINNVRRVFSSFFKYLENEGFIIMNPLKQVPKIKEPQRVKKAFTDEEIEKMRHVLQEKSDTKLGQRNIAIFEMFLSSGLRLTELSTLKKDDISLVDCKGVCLGKGNKQRIFYFSERCKLALKLYLESRVDDNEYLFVSGNAPYNRLGLSGIEYMFRRVGNDAEIEKVHPHRFRRTLATRLIRKGMPIDQVSKVLGHESLSITQRYIESDRDMLKLTHKRHLN